MGYGVFVRGAGAGRTLTKRLIVNGRGDEDEWECDPPRGGRGRRVPALVIVPRGQATRARGAARRGVAQAWRATAPPTFTFPLGGRGRHTKTGRVLGSRQSQVTDQMAARTSLAVFRRRASLAPSPPSALNAPFLSLSSCIRLSRTSPSPRTMSTFTQVRLP